MSNCQEIREMMIDVIYGEQENKVIAEHIERCSECRDYYKEISSVLKRMEITELQIPIPLSDIENVIKKAEHIKSIGRKRLENIIFILSSMSLLSVVLLLSLKFGGTLILLIQILAYMNLPLVLIPIMRKRGLKEGI